MVINTQVNKTELQKFDKVDLMYQHLGNKINNYLREGLDLDSITNSLDDTCKKFKITMSTSKEVDTRYKYLYTHNAVAGKIIEDIAFVKSLRRQYHVFQSYDTRKMINLINFRNKALGKNKLTIVVPETKD
jgi:hypothetical protein